MYMLISRKIALIKDRHSLTDLSSTLCGNHLKFTSRSRKIGLDFTLGKHLEFH